MYHTIETCAQLGVSAETHFYTIIITLLVCTIVCGTISLITKEHTE